MAGVDLQAIVNRAINGGGDHLELMADALRVRVLPAAGPRSWWRDRLRFLASATVTTLRQARREAPLISAPVGVCSPGNGDARARDVRRFFLRHHFGLESDCVGRGAQRRSRRRPSPAWWAWWVRGVGWALLGLADWSAQRYTWLGGALVDMQLFKRLEGELDQVYLFGFYDRRQYLLLTFLARHTHITATAVYQNVPLARNCRHLHVEVPVVLTSRVNLSEVDYYRERGSFRPLSVTYASQEYALDTHDLAPHAPLYDIGYYSSGEWARREGLYQAGPDDLERVRHGEFADNPYARAADTQIAALVAYAHKEHRTLRIYPHPLERGLMRAGVALPYAGLADGVDVSIDDGGEATSRRTIYDTRVAVSLQSSFIWERLDLGLDDSYLHEFPDPAMNVFERAALGRYAGNVCATSDELIAKVDAALRRYQARDEVTPA